MCAPTKIKICIPGILIVVFVIFWNGYESMVKISFVYLHSWVYLTLRCCTNNFHVFKIDRLDQGMVSKTSELLHVKL